MPERTLPSFDLKRNFKRVKGEIAEAIERVLESQHFILGPEVEKFEAEITSYLGVEHAIGCASGSDALLLALMALDVSEKDEVITTPYTFFATASCIARLGARPVFVDVDPKTYNISIEGIKEAISEKTKVILPVHLFGQMAKVEEIGKVAPGKTMVEDAAQAIGAVRFIEERGVKAGTVGDLACFSFFPTKNLGAYGDGGMVVTRCEKLAYRISRLRVHGAGSQYMHEEIGINSRLDAIQAAILRVRLKHLEVWNEERRKAAARYNLLIAEKGLEEWVAVPETEENNHHTYHQYVVRCKRRDDLQEFLKGKGITTRVYYPVPLHMQKCFEYLGYKQGQFPVAEMLSKESLALPMFPEIKPEEQEWVVENIRQFYLK